MTKKYTKRQHYIPQFYLKRFTDEEGYLHVYDMENKKYFHTAPINFGCENNLYETPISTPNKLGEQFLLRNDIENTFARYEGEFASFLKRLDHICTPNQNPNALILNKEEKEILYRLISNILLRNPITMDELELNNTDYMDLDEKERLDKVLGALSLCSINELIRFTNKKFVLTEEIDGNGIKQITDNIRKLIYVFMYSPKRHFITSSFPITIGEDVVISGEDKTCIYCALSPSLSVLFGNYNELEKYSNRMTVLDEESIVNAFNKQTAKPIANRKRLLIASSKEDLIRYMR